MRLALIPPLTRLDDTLDQDIHLILPALLRDERYTMYLQEVCASGQDYVIMDNGLAEGTQTPADVLVILASQFGVDELVVPDSMANRQQSVEMARDFVNFTLPAMAKQDHRYHNRLAFVAQGISPREVFYCMQDYMEQFSEHVHTIMIPRHLVTPEQPHARLGLAESFYNWAGNSRVNIHLLGGSKCFPQEIKYAREYPFIRSMDTSLPYVFARAGMELTDVGIGPVHRGSDETYWDWKPEDEIYRDCLMANLGQYRRWAAGDE